MIEDLGEGVDGFVEDGGGAEAGAPAGDRIGGDEAFLDAGTGHPEGEGLEGGAMGLGDAGEGLRGIGERIDDAGGEVGGGVEVGR